MLAWVPPLILLAVFGIGVRFESRRFGLGLILTAALGWLALLGFAWLIGAVGTLADEMAVAWFILGALGLMVALVAVLGVFLIVNAITMHRREGLGSRRCCREVSAWRSWSTCWRRSWWW
ncbi:hypothetical protein G7085_20220 [Tessaracoccus sp. HDW20]|uniref:hypothetical protein n=1 Tax=Tessaracoccus coleopterorum TaxID=2714950 RepID=UPI0018D47625|nr:hypothetical protein [Tessaracoccus coleopterorum]NHB86067.1 hypothetical protein [Tessaracoccus coleopterorum]